MGFDYKSFKKARSQQETEKPEWAGWKWVKSWWGLIVVPFIYDVYISKKIKWTWWKELESDVARTIMSWVDAIVFASQRVNQRLMNYAETKGKPILPYEATEDLTEQCKRHWDFYQTLLEEHE